MRYLIRLLFVGFLFGAVSPAAANDRGKAFSVRNFPQIVQGMSLKDLRGVVGNLNRSCSQELVPSDDDPSIFMLTLCKKPEVYLSFCNDQLYWASVYRKRGFHGFIGDLRNYTVNKATHAFLKVSDVAAESQQRAVSGEMRDAHLSVSLSSEAYTVTLTMFSAEAGKVADDYRLDFQANNVTEACK